MSDTQDIFGVPHSLLTKKETIESCINYKPEKGDIFLATYLKCGTNWTFNILSRILAKGSPPPKTVGVCDVFFDIIGGELTKERPKPRLIPTHMQHRFVPQSPDAKYICVYRNPKDACVSYYKHLSIMPKFGMNITTFEEFFEKNFLTGEIAWGDYFDHLLSWYPHRNEPNVLFMTYEAMKKDIKGSVLKMAAFLGKEYEDFVNDEKNMAEIVQKTSLKSMYDDLANVTKKVEESVNDIYQKPEENKGLITFLDWHNRLGGDTEKKTLLNPTCLIRKGEVGDWRNYFTEDQSRRLEEKFWKVSQGQNIADLWKDVDWMITRPLTKA